LPIYLEVLRKVSVIEKKVDKNEESSDIESKIDVSAGKSKLKKKKSIKSIKPIPCDLRHILGFLN